MGRFADKIASSRLLLTLCMVSLLIMAGPFQLRPVRVYADELKPRALKVSNSVAGAQNVTYQLTFQVTTPGLIGSVVLELCSNSALQVDPCTPPFGFDASAAMLSSQTGMTGFIISPTSTANRLVLTRPPAAESNVVATFTFDNITNSSTGGPMYGRIQTYANSLGSGAHIDDGGLALYFPLALDLSAEVPPYLTFCVGESIVNFDCNTATEAFTDLGTLSSHVTSAAQSQLVIATNANNGYTMWAVGSTMTSGNNTIATMAGGPSLTGTPQFGLNLRANASPVIGQDATGPGNGTPTAAYGVPNQFRYNSGDTLATHAQPDDYRKYTVSYIVNVPSNQPGGVYSTTLTYIALGNF